jgi:hypothetical protein
MLHGDRRVSRFEKAPQRCYRELHLGELVFQSAQMGGDQSVTRLMVRRGQDSLDILDSHVEATEKRRMTCAVGT